MEPCMVCEFARHVSPAAIGAALEEHYNQFPDSDWDYWDEACHREHQYCIPCPYEYAWEAPAPAEEE